MKRILACFVLACAGLASISQGAMAQEYPSKPIRLIVPFAPGGGTDAVARVLSKMLSESMKVPVVVDNRPGAGSNLGTRLAARAEADGYTLLVTSTAFAINPSLYKAPGYDATRDFVPVINAGYSPTILFVNPAVPAKTLADLVALGRKQSLSYSTAGVGTVPFLSSERLLNKLAGMHVVHVPYAGAGPALLAVIGGHVPLGSAAYATPGLEEFFAAGKLRPIAVTSAQRMPAQPNVPTVSESGFPGFVENTWIGVFAPARTPKDIVERLNHAMNQALQNSEVQEQLTRVGFSWKPNSADEYAKYMKAELVKWADIVKVTGAHAED